MSFGSSRTHLHELSGRDCCFACAALTSTLAGLLRGGSCSKSSLQTPFLGPPDSLFRTPSIARVLKDLLFENLFVRSRGLHSVCVVHLLEGL